MSISAILPCLTVKATTRERAPLGGQDHARRSVHQRRLRHAGKAAGGEHLPGHGLRAAHHQAQAVCRCPAPPSCSPDCQNVSSQMESRPEVGGGLATWLIPRARIGPYGAGSTARPGSSARLIDAKANIDTWRRVGNRNLDRLILLLTVCD